MSHLSDKDLDHLAREAAEQLDVDQNSSGWEALQSKLDEEMPVEKRRRRWFFFLLFPLLGAILFYAYQANQGHTNNADVKTEQTSKAKPEKHDAPATSSYNNEKNADPVDPAVNNQSRSNLSESNTSGIATSQSAIGSGNKIISPTDNTAPQPITVTNDNSSTTAAPRKPASKRVIASTQPLAGSQLPDAGKRQTTSKSGPSYYTKKDSASKARTTPNSEHAVPRDASSPDNKVDESPTSNDISGEKDADKKLTNSLQDSIARNVPIQSTDSSKLPNHTIITDSEVAAKPLPPKKEKPGSKTAMPYKGLTFGLIVGPDISEVNKKGTDKTGINFGLLAAYRFNGRLSVVSGLSYTHKFYTAYGTDYKPNKGTWLDTVSLSKVEGDCYMFEIPVNLRFDLLASLKNYAFISAGLSSYFMKKENYDFHYTNNSVQYDSRYRSYNVSEQYLFKVLNLSIGYERMMTKRLSLQLEPYIKLPLNGLGFGNMQLSSYGAFFGVKYHAGQLKAR